MEKGETHTAMRNISEKGKCTTYGVSHVAIPTFLLLLSPLHINIQWYMQVYWRSAKSKKKEKKTSSVFPHMANAENVPIAGDSGSDFR